MLRKLVKRLLLPVRALLGAFCVTVLYFAITLILTAFCLTLLLLTPLAFALGFGVILLGDKNE